MTGAGDGSIDDLVRGFVRRVLNLREERKAISDDIAGELKEARARGLDSRKITEVCQWLEKVEKHGREEMIMAEEMFNIYRDIAEGAGRPIAEEFTEKRDKALAELFASPPDEKPKAPTLRQKAASTALTFAAISKMNRGAG